MPRNGSMILSDLTAQRLGVACAKCERRGSYSVAALIARLGPDHRLTDLLDELTDGCPRRGPHGFLDQCAARFGGLADATDSEVPKA